MIVFVSLLFGGGIVGGGELGKGSIGRTMHVLFFYLWCNRSGEVMG